MIVPFMRRSGRRTPTANEIKYRSKQLKRRLWLTFVLPPFLAALIIRIVRTLVRIKILDLAVQAAGTDKNQSEPVPVILPKASVERIPVETVSEKA